MVVVRVVVVVVVVGGGGRVDGTVGRGVSEFEE